MQTQQLKVSFWPQLKIKAFNIKAITFYLVTNLGLF